MLELQRLGAYLTDHLAGATAGVELAERLRSENEGGRFEEVLAQLAEEIKEDRSTLESLIGRLDIEKSPAKQAVGWGFEKLSRLRLNKQLTGSEDLTTLLEAETLSLGIEGKALMWRALREIAKLDQRLAETDFDQLTDRAMSQRERLEPFRIEAATNAFST
jgi:hypothetical protein